MIRDISDICLQDTQNHVHTFTSKYRCGSPPKEPLEEPIRDSWLRRPGPPSGRFPFSRSGNWVHTWSAGSEWTTQGQLRVSGRQASVSAHHEGRGKHSNSGGYVSTNHEGLGKHSNSGGYAWSCVARPVSGSPNYDSAATFARTMFRADPATNHSTCSGLNVCVVSNS